MKPIIQKLTDPFGITYEKIRGNPDCKKNIGEDTCGRCTWTMSDRIQYVGENKKTWLYNKSWSTLKEECLLFPTESQAATKAFFLQICKKYNSCNKNMARWRIKVDSI